MYIPGRRRDMRRTVTLLAVFTLLTAGLAAAQEDERANSLAAGSWALMFGIDSNFTLEPFEGGSLSLKRHFSDKSALRAGIDFGFGSSESNTETTLASEAIQDTYSFALEGLYQRYTSPGRTINFYWGAGGYGGYTDRTSEATADSTLNRDTSTAYNLGATGVLGVEFFASRAIGLHAEYRGSVGYRWSESASFRQRPGMPDLESHRDSSGWTVGGTWVRFGLSAYF